ncbi:MAG: lysylphosphatidylglycerol synthase transmembrane domain-containing protein [Pirellulaceae bacterium]
MEPLRDSPGVREGRWSRQGLRLLKLLFRIVVLALVTWGIWKTVQQARRDFAEHQFSLEQVDAWWLCAAGLLYLAGLAPCGVFWHRTLWAMSQQPTWRESMRAFWIGHLGKYVPGKAMVVILRTGLVYSERVNRTVAATSVFIETLTMMAVGAFASAVILLLTSDHAVLTWLAGGLMLLSGLPTYPPVFRRLVRWLQVHRANPQIDQAIAGIDGRLMGFGWLIISIGWLVLGLSLWATLRAIPGVETSWLESLRELPLLTAAVGLAMVAGFLSLIPGGLGVRDWILMTLLVPRYGAKTAIVSTVLLRIVWLLSELVVSAILYVDVLRVRRRTT